MYILQSEKDNSFYIGSTQDLTKRLIRHNKGYSRYTKNKGPFKLVYKEDFQTLSQTRKRELYLKSLKSRVAILKLISKAPFV